MACDNRRGKIEMALKKSGTGFAIDEMHEFEDDEHANPYTGKRQMGGCFVIFARRHNMFGKLSYEVMMCDALINDPVGLESWLRQSLEKIWGRAVERGYKGNLKWEKMN